MIVGIYLAAGKSSRFGTSKINYPVDGLPLGAMALRVAVNSILDKVIVVTKETDNLNWIPPDLKEHEKVGFVLAAEAEKGQAYSIKAGLTRAVEYDAEAVMIMLADQPLVEVGLINKLATIFLSEKSLHFVGAEYQAVVSPPILLAKIVFPEIFKLSGDKGAKGIIAGRPEAGYLLAIESKRSFFDVDRPEDMWQLEKMLETASLMNKDAPSKF